MSRAPAVPGTLHTTAETSRILGVSDETVRAYIASGDLTAINIAGKAGDVRWRISDHAIAAFCAAREYHPTVRRRTRRAS